MVITITDNASRQIRDMMKEEPDNVYFRFGVQGGGCSGLSYTMGFDENINEELDFVGEINGVPVVIFKQDMPILENTVIDYKENLMGGGFSIDNPNAVFSCGCGSSFRTKDRVGSPGDC